MGLLRYELIRLTNEPAMEPRTNVEEEAISKPCTAALPRSLSG